MRKVAVTGMGLITPLGNNVGSTWDKIKKGKSAFDIVEFNQKKYFAGRVKDFFPMECVKDNDKFIQFALNASCEAVVDSQIDVKVLNKERIGCIVSSSKGGMETFSDMCSNNNKENFLNNFLPHMATSVVSDYFGLLGPITCLSTACSTGGYSILEGVKYIEEDKCDVVIAGSSEASIVPLVLAGFDKIGVLSKETNGIDTAVLPFDKRRSGFVISEGAGVLILEELEHAKNRGVKIYCIISGYGMTSDAYHITSFNPSSESISNAISLSLKKAGLYNKDIDYINAHGTGTVMNDIIETKAIKQVFNGYAKKVNISSTKSMTGHLLGASGSVEFIFAALAIRDGFVPPTINLDDIDPECDLNYTPKIGVNKEIKNALSLSFGFGGNIVSLIASKEFKSSESL